LTTTRCLLFCLIPLLAAFAPQTADRSEQDEKAFTPLFNGQDLDGWVVVNGDDSTWRAENGMLRTTGEPTGVLRTDRMYENFILELKWRHESPKGNAGLFVWSDPLPALGVPFTRAVEVQVMLGLETPNYTSEGDIFPIWGARMTPERPHPAGWSRCLPSEARTKGAGEWNHYRVTCIDGTISLEVNGGKVSGGYDINPRKGYICLEAEGSPADFRDIIIRELPSSNSPLAEVANDAVGFTTLFNGLDLDGWSADGGGEGSWTVKGGRIIHDGSGGNLWTTESYGDMVLTVDWRWAGPSQGRMMRPVIGPDGANTGEEVEIDEYDSGIYLRGSSKSQVNMWEWPIGSGEVYGYRTDGAQPAEVRAGVTPTARADAPVGSWNRFIITMRGELLTVNLNGTTVIHEARLPGIDARGPIALQSHHSGVEFMNVFIQELD
jgi:hypothetical protein